MPFKNKIKNRNYQREWAQQRTKFKPAKLKEHNIMRKKRSWEIKLEILNHYGRGELRCDCCKEIKHPMKLTIDHIGGGGRKHKKEIGVSGGGEFYRWLKRNNYPDGFRVLCWDCNGAIGAYGWCPDRGPQKELPLDKYNPENNKDKNQLNLFIWPDSNQRPRD